jgi:hypothetical protein
MCRIQGALNATDGDAMKTIPLNGVLLKQLISKRFTDGVTGIQDAWHARFTDGSGDDEAEVPNRSTIYRWRQGRWPGSKTELVRLSSLLDIDPLCLLDINEDNAPEAMAVLYQSYQSKRWAPQALSLLSDFVGHKQDWPPKYVSEEYYGRDWSIREFEHDLTLGKNFYPLIQIAGSPTVYENRPQVFHFAYRHNALFGLQWVQYGYVLRYGKDCRLISINGHIESAQALAPEFPTLVETFFGPSPTIFRIASLHEFTVEIIAERAVNGNCVRFPA